VSTAPTTLAPVRVTSNKYELFEHMLSFLESEGELNPVLCGYFTKVLAQLISNKAKEVYTYVYSHTHVLENLIRHSYQKSLAEVLVKLLNPASDNLFNPDVVNIQEVTSIRESFILKLAEKLSPDQTFEDHLNAGQILSELMDSKLVQRALMSDRCLELFIKCLVSDSESAKQNTYIVLANLIAKTHQ
jgi:hypothetical protein